MDRRLLVDTAAARRAKHRLQRAISLSLIGFPLWFCVGASISLMAQSRGGLPRPSGAGGAVRPAVAHQHVGSWCLGMDEEIRRAYHLFLGYNNRKAASACAPKFKVPRWAINRRAAMLGLARIKEREWNPAELSRSSGSRGSETSVTSSIGIAIGRTSATLSGAQSQRKNCQAVPGGYSSGEAVVTAAGNDRP